MLFGQFYKWLQLINAVKVFLYGPDIQIFYQPDILNTVALFNDIIQALGIPIAEKVCSVLNKSQTHNNYFLKEKTKKQEIQQHKYL